MVDRSALLYSTVADRDALDEYIVHLGDLLPGIERDVAQLKRTPHDQTVISDLFRALHNLKGDATICRVEIGTLILHPLETVIGRVRAGDIEFSGVLAEVVLLTMDRLEMALDALDQSRTFEYLRLPALLDGLEALATAQGPALEASALQLIENVTGFRPTSIGQSIQSDHAAPPGSPSRPVAEDLRFFMELAARLDACSPLFAGRTDRLLRMAQDTNSAAAMPVDNTQLTAAICMHDIGMMFMSGSSWREPGKKFTQEELEQLRAHPLHAAGLLARMPGWEGAARMVREHHEMPDGGGYPAGLKGQKICDGAKIIAIVDAFESITTRHAQRGQNRSILRAIAEINASDKQFDPAWIACFNAVMKKKLEN